MDDFSSESKVRTLLTEGEKLASPEVADGRVLNELGGDCHFVLFELMEKLGVPYGKAISDFFELRAESVKSASKWSDEWEEPLIQPTIIYDFPLAVSPAIQEKARRARLGRTLRVLHRRLRGRQRLLRAERPRRPARALRTANDGKGTRGQRSPPDGRRLRPRPRLWSSTHRRRRHRHRPPHDAPHQLQIHPRRHPLSSPSPSAEVQTRQAAALEAKHGESAE